MIHKSGINRKIFVQCAPCPLLSCRLVERNDLVTAIKGLGFNANKCSQYWPDMIGSSRRYQDIEVQLYDRQEAPDYLVHKLDVSRYYCDQIMNILIRGRTQTT